MTRCGLVSVLFLLDATLALAQPVPAEQEALSRVGLPGESQRTARRLVAADKLVAEQKWAEAVEACQRILIEVGDDLVPLNARHSLQARWLCHLRLAALPPAALRLYRARVDGQARKWLDQAVAGRDVDLLRRLVDEVFCSRFTDQALDQLGDLAFERGEFEEAERWWRMLALPALRRDKGPRIKDTLLFPDPQVDEARVRAKQFLARLFRGEQTGLQEEWEAYKKLHGQAEGYLAGKKGNYAAILEEFAGQAELRVGVTENEAWPTFAGDAARGYILPRAGGRLLRLPQVEGPTWRVELEARGRGLEADSERPVSGKAMPPSQAARSLAFYPLIVGDQVVVADARHVMAYELSTGRQVLRYDVAPERSDAELGITLRLPAVADLGYPLTAAGDRIYARLGAQSLGSRRSGDQDSFLVCLNWPETSGRKTERWLVSKPPPEGSQSMFEGAPIVHHGQVYIAVARQAGIQVQTLVACYDADTGALRWQREICDTQELKDAERRTRHHLLTLAGATIVYCSHSGAIVALDAASGRRAWAVRYPSRGTKTTDRTPSPRGLAPCLYAGGRLYAAPLDFDRILCLDAATGHQLWESTPLEVIHLLGVAKGRLIFTTTTPRRGIRALDAATGNPRRSWFQPADGTDLASFGRGLLAGDYVFWPTRGTNSTASSGAQNRLYVLNQEDGEPVIDPVDSIGGNLAAANGCLVVADATSLSAYLPDDLLLPARRREATENPRSARARYRLALAEAGAGLVSEALEDLLQVESLAGPTERWRRLPLAEAARRRRFELLLEEAERAQKARRWQDAASFLAQTATSDFPVSARLRALAQQASLWARAGQPAQAIQTWQTILGDANLSQGHLLDSSGLPQPAAAFAADRIRELDPDQPLRGLIARQLPRPVSCQAKVVLPPDPQLPLSRAWHSASINEGLDPDEHFRLADAGPECAPGNVCLYSVRDTTLICREAFSGQRCWQRMLPANPSWIGHHADLVLTAAADHIFGFRREDGEPVWSWFPVTDYGLPTPSYGPQSLGNFQLAGSRLFFLQDQRRLLALDAGSGQCLWSFWAPAAKLQLPTPAGQFHRKYYVGDQGVVLQTTAGRLFVLDSRTGRPLHEAATTREPWQQAPLAVDDRRVCIVTDSEHILFLDSATGKELWTHALERPLSLNGRAPQILANRETVLVLVFRNSGCELECLDPATGSQRWPQPRFLGTRPADLVLGTVDDTAVYLPSAGSLRAYALADGKLIWQRPLAGSAGRWRALRKGALIALFPAETEALRLQLGWLSRSFQALISCPSAKEPGGYFPVMFCDPKTGQLIQRLNLPVPGPELVTKSDPNPVPSLVPRLSLDLIQVEGVHLPVQFFERGLAVVLGGKAWTLTAENAR